MSLKITVSYILIIFHVFWGHTSRRNKSYLTFSKTITFCCQLQIGTCQQHCLVAPLVKKPPAMRETWVPSLGQEDPLEKGKATHFSSLAWRPPWTGLMSLWPWGHKELNTTATRAFAICLASLVAQMVKRLPATWETRVQSLGQEDPLENELATHSSILAWKIPWTEEPGRL